MRQKNITYGGDIVKITTKTMITDEGIKYTAYGAVISFPSGDYIIDDISCQKDDVELYELMFNHFPSLSSDNIENFTADYISMLSKYSA